MGLNRPNDRMDHALAEAPDIASLRSMVVGEREALAALLAVLLAAISGDCGQDPLCVCAKGKRPTTLLAELLAAMDRGCGRRLQSVCARSNDQLSHQIVLHKRPPDIGL